MLITHDGEIDIATGKSRKTANWKNKKVKWSELVKKISETHRTAETYADYMSSKPDRQDEIKDIGGFVGGYLVNGKRRNGTVGHRQLITLDVDYAKPGFWEDFLLCYGCAAAMYTTHKHSAEKPRIRIVIPLSHEIFPDQYEPICRRIAGDLDIEAFTDVTTYEATRLMYWPSTAKDGLFMFDVQDGPWLDPDQVLSRYVNWQDSSEWPVCSTERDKVKRDIKKQQDPLEKPGVIGAFCRTYSITDVIEKFLADAYEPTASAERFTYLHGSTAGGLVVYDDKFAFSHHGTDPCGGKLCNAFDLVRIHKFGVRDDGKQDMTASMEAMQQFITRDKEVIAQLGKERFAEAIEDFQLMAGVEPGEVVQDITDQLEKLAIDVEWLKKLEIDKKGNYNSSIDNIYKVLKNDPLLKGRLYFDEFENWLKIKGNLPWRRVKAGRVEFSDDDSDCLAHYLECLKIPFTHIDKALALIRNDTAVHPVREYLDSLSWDGTDRLDTMLIDYLGADDNEYVRAATRKTFVAAVARIYEPGIKFDTVLTIVGEEGIGKSTVPRLMFGKWFSDCLGDIHDKSGMESLRGIWGMEISELSGFRRSDEETIKRFIASPADVYRPAYAKQLVRFPRQCIFIATSNKEDFLKAGHKHRRFLPVSTDNSFAIKDIFTELTQAEIDQLWAEAYTYYQAGESLDLSREQKQLAAKIREQHTEVDERAGLVQAYLDFKITEDWDIKTIAERIQFIRYGKANEFDDEMTGGTVQRNQVCIAEIWCEMMERRPGDMTNQNTKYLHDIMKKMKGWLPCNNQKRFGIYGKQRMYIRAVKPG